MRKSCWRGIALALTVLFVPVLVFLGIGGIDARADEEQTIQVKVDQDDLLDIVLTLGDTDTDVSTVDDDLMAALTAKGIPADKIKIEAVQSSQVSAGNTATGWEIYDHTNFVASEIPYYRPYYNDPYAGQVYAPGYEPQWNVANHIEVTIEDGMTNIDFRGYGAPAYKDFMVMPNSEFGKKSFSFTIQEGYFYDALDGAGFLFNTTMTPNTDLANRYMSGYLVFFNYPSSGSIPVIEVYKFTNIQVNTFHNHTSTKIENYSGFTRLARSTLPGSETTRGVEIEATADSIKMWYNDTQVVWTLTAGGTATEVALDTDFGAYGFGPITGYSSHSCARPTLFTFIDVSMSTESTKRFSEVIREPEWRDESKRFIINAQDSAVDDFSDAQALGEILARLGNENIHYLGWGRDEADGSAFIEKNSGNGVFVDKDDPDTDTYEEQIAALADYIYGIYIDSVENDTQYLIYGKPSSLSITPESEQTNTIDDNWPQGKWRVDHDENFYENPTGTVPYDGLYLNNLDISFTETGKYDLYYQDTLVKTLYVHRKPVAGFSVSLDGSLNVNITDNAYDPDAQSDPDHGIQSTSWAYKLTTDSDWTLGMPDTFTAEQNYIIRQEVTDGLGVVSDPYYRYISTETGVSLPPVAEFQITPSRLLTYQSETIAYTDTSYDPQGGAITGWDWSVALGGSVIYTGATPMTDFSAVAAGTYKITLSVKNADNVWSEDVARYLTVVRDDTPPTAVCNTASGAYNEPKVIRLTFSDEDGGSGFSYRYAQITGTTDVPGEWGSMGTNSVYNVSVATLGTHYIHYRVFDHAGNETVAYFGPFTMTDIQPPTDPDLDCSPAYSDGSWANQAITVTASGSTDDFTAAGNLVYEVSTDGVIYVASSNITLWEDGEYTVTFKVTDESDNSTTVSKTVRIDRTAPTQPTLGMTSDGGVYLGGTWATHAVTATLAGSTDAGGSGFWKYEYKIDDGAWQAGSTISFPDSGIFTLAYRSVDNAGNVSETGSQTVKVDLAAPETLDIQTTVTTIDRITVSVTATDALSGIAPLGYRVYNGTSWSPWQSTLDQTLTGYGRGETVHLQFQARDNAGNVRTESVTVQTLLNTAPTAVDDTFTLQEDGGARVLDVLLNDTDADLDTNLGDTLTVVSVSALSSPAAGRLALVNGVITYTPARNYNGTFTFTYTMEDEYAARSTATATVRVTAVNDPPVAMDDAVTTQEDTPILINVLANDTDVDSTPYISALGNPAHGTATRSGSGILYTPDADFYGTDSFIYTISDGEYTDTATVTVTVTAVNDPPDLQPDQGQTIMGQPVTLDVLANDTDKDSPTITLVSVTNPGHGTAVIKDNLIVYTPEDGYSGTDSFTYTASDGQDSATAVVTITVSVPEFIRQNTTAFKPGQPAGGNGDGEPGGGITILKPPAKGSVTAVGNTIYFTPDEDTQGVGTYQFSMEVNGQSVTYTSVTWTDPRTGDTQTLGYGIPLTEDSFETPKNTTLRIDLSQILGRNVDGAQINITGLPSEGQVTIEDGVLVYTPSEGFTGTDALIITLEQDGEQVPYAAVISVQDTPDAAPVPLFSWWCVVGWVIAALLLWLNHRLHKSYFRPRRYRTVVYILTGAVVMLVLCWLRSLIGFYIPAGAMALYIIVNYAYAAIRVRTMEPAE